jgi:hypothetical protein
VFGQGKVRSILYVAPRGEAGYTGALIDLESEDVLFFPGASDTGPINFADGKIAFEIKSVEMHFEGTVSPSGDEIKGKFTEGEIRPMISVSSRLVRTLPSGKPSHWRVT